MERPRKKKPKEKRRPDEALVPNGKPQGRRVPQPPKKDPKSTSGKDRSTVPGAEKLKSSRPVPSLLTSIFLLLPGQWTRLGLLNLALALAVASAGAGCVLLHTGGDLSARGLRAAWPRAQRNSALLLNATLDALSADGLKSAADAAWRSVAPWTRKVHATLALCLAGVQGAGPSWLWEGLAGFDWEGLLSRGKEVAGFLLGQFGVLSAEFWRSELVLETWADLLPVRQALSGYTEGLRGFCLHYWPLLSQLLTGTKAFIEDLWQ